MCEVVQQFTFPWITRHFRVRIFGELSGVIIGVEVVHVGHLIGPDRVHNEHMGLFDVGQEQAVHGLVPNPVLVKVDDLKALLGEVLKVGQGLEVEPAQLESVRFASLQIPGNVFVNHAQASQVHNRSKFQRNLGLVDALNI